MTEPRPPEGKQCGCQINHVGLYDEEEGIDPTMSTIIYCPMHLAAPKLVAAVENMILMLQGIAQERSENPEEWANYRRLEALLREAAK